MKSFIATFILIFSLYTNAWAQPEINAEILNYKSQEHKPYLELQFRIPSRTVVFKEIANKQFQAKLLISIAMLKEQDTVYSDQYELLSPIQTSPTGNNSMVDFRILPSKKELHRVILSVTDQANQLSSSVEKMVVAGASAKSKFSNIMLVEKYTAVAEPSLITKCNMIIIPRLMPLIREDEEFLTFYAEYYGNAKTVNFNLVNSDSQKVISQKLNCIEYGEIKAILYTISIDNLQGDYEINLSSGEESAFQWTSKRIRVINEQKVNFFTQNLNYSTLQIYTKYLWPIALGAAWDRLDSVIKTNDTAALKTEFYQFWAAQMPEDPELAWKRYLELVVIANKRFSVPGMEGYRTDRGRIYLKYGKPVDITEYHDDPYTYPYEIWQYYSLGIYGKAEFIFTNLAQTGQMFTLIHSTAPGEPSNLNWKKQIERGNGNPRDNWGSDW